MRADGTGDRVLIADLPDEPSAMQWAADSRGLHYAVNQRGTHNLRFVSVDGRDREVTKGAWRLNLTSFSRTGAAVGALETPSEAGEVVSVDLRSGKVRRLTNVNAGAAKGVDLAAADEIRASSADGTAIQGWMIKPPDYDPARRYPMILDIHGGPHRMIGGGSTFAIRTSPPAVM